MTNPIIKVLGLKEVEAFLNEKSAEILVKANDGVKNATLFLQGEVKQSISGHRAEPASVDTGRFLNSVEVQFGNLDGMVFTELGYPVFLENGTSKISPRKHFGNSRARSQTKITELIQTEVNKV